MWEEGRPRRGIRSWVRQGASFSGHERNRLFVQNRENERIEFEDRSLVSGADAKADGRAFGHLDVDRDGDLDLFLVNANAPRVQFFENQLSTETHSLWVDLVGGAEEASPQNNHSNRDAVGARAVATLKGRVLHREKRAGEGFASQNTGWLHFGVGDQESIESVVVNWPSGQITEIPGPIGSGQRIRIYESSSDAPTRSNWEVVSPLLR